MQSLDIETVVVCCLLFVVLYEELGVSSRREAAVQELKTNVSSFRGQIIGWLGWCVLLVVPGVDVALVAAGGAGA